MVHLYLPNIESINFANNYITNLNSLAKMDLKKVNNLDLSGNLIQEVSRLHLVNVKMSSVKISLRFDLAISKKTWKLI